MRFTVWLLILFLASFINLVSAEEYFGVSPYLDLDECIVFEIDEAGSVAIPNTFPIEFGTYRGVKVTQDGRFAAVRSASSGYESYLYMLAFNNGHQLIGNTAHYFDGGITDIAFSNDGSLLVVYIVFQIDEKDKALTIESELQVYSVSDEGELLLTHIKDVEPPYYAMSKIEISSKNILIGLHILDQTLFSFRLTDDGEIIDTGSSVYFEYLAAKNFEISPDGRFCVVQGMYLWDTVEELYVVRIHDNGDIEFTGFSYDIENVSNPGVGVFTSDSKYLVISSTDYQYLTSYEMSEDGSLTFAGASQDHTQGKITGGLGITYDDKYIVAPGNIYGNGIVTLYRLNKDGTLTYIADTPTPDIIGGIGLLPSSEATIKAWQLY